MVTALASVINLSAVSMERWRKNNFCHLVLCIVLFSSLLLQIYRYSSPDALPLLVHPNQLQVGWTGQVKSCESSKSNWLHCTAWCYSQGQGF